MRKKGEGKMSENKIRSLAPYIARLTWMWANRAISHLKEKSTQSQEVIRLVQLAAERGDPEAKWWISHRHLIVTMAVNKPSSYSEEDLMRAQYHYYIYGGEESLRKGLAEAAEWGHSDTILAIAPHVCYNASLTPGRPTFIDEIFKNAAALGSVYALKEMGADLSAHRASIEERALNGCFEAAVYLTEYETDSGRDPLLPLNDAKTCTANDALLRFLLIFSGVIHPVHNQNRHFDNNVFKVIGTIHGSAARYQFGLCMHQMRDVIPDWVTVLSMPCKYFYLQSSEAAKEAVNTWILVGRRSGICRDMRKMIGELIWADRVEWTLTNSNAVAAVEPRRSTRKRIKKVSV